MMSFRREPFPPRSIAGAGRIYRSQFRFHQPFVSDELKSPVYWASKLTALISI